MLLYHGTPRRNADHIHSEGKIRPTDSEISQYGTGYTATTNGYVYLSSNLNGAVGWGLNAVKERVYGMRITVFEVNLDEEPPPDPDEENWGSIVSHVKSSSFVVSRPLLLSQDVTRYVELDFKDINDGYRSADDPVLLLTHNVHQKTA